MTLKLVREKAKDLGIKNISRYRKEHLIRVIQEAEGNCACYKGIPDCQQSDCLWRAECQE